MRRVNHVSWRDRLIATAAVVPLAAIAACSSSASSASSQQPSTSQTAAAPGVVTNTAQAQPQTLNIPVGSYVALGDSFSSGEGNAPFYVGTDSNGDNCHRSRLGYAMQLYHLGGPALLPDNFVACSGAQIQDLFSGNHQYNVSGSEPPQANRLGLHVGLVTMTMGGNNLGRNGNGLGDLLQYCMFHRSACHQDLQAGVTDRLHALDGTRPGNTNPYDLVRVYEKLRQDAPNARILIAGYPHEFTGQHPKSCENIDTTDQPWMNQVIDSLNSVIKSNIQAANNAANARIEYVDPVPFFTGHALDDGASCEWAGQAFVNESAATVSQRNGWFHPNALGQVLYAEAFMEELRQPSPMSASNPTSTRQAAPCESKEFLLVLASRGYKSATISGPPKCADGYGLQLFTAGPGGQAAQFFFEQHWTLLEGGDAIPTIACQEIPASTLIKLGAQCPPAAYAKPSPPTSATGNCSSAVFLKLMLAQGATFTGVSGPAKCLNGYAEQNFTFPQGSTSNYPTYFFQSDGHGGWTVLGGGAIGDVTSVCSSLPTDVRSAFTLPATAGSGCPAG
jgi:hypothetical protein